MGDKIVKNYDNFVQFMTKVDKLYKIYMRGPVLRSDMYRIFTVEELGWFLEFIKVDFVDTWKCDGEEVCSVLKVHNPGYIPRHIQINSKFLSEQPTHFPVSDALIEDVDDIYFRRTVLGATSDE